MYININSTDRPEPRRFACLFINILLQLKWLISCHIVTQFYNIEVTRTSCSDMYVHVHCLIRKLIISQYCSIALTSLLAICSHCFYCCLEVLFHNASVNKYEEGNTDMYLIYIVQPHERHSNARKQYAQIRHSS